MPSKEYRIQRAIEGRPIIEKSRPGDRHKKGYVRPKKQEYVKRDNKWERRSIVAWDGEGANLDTGEHVYNLLANSHGDKIVNMEGLSTVEVFKFFLANSNENDINVIFGGSYDVNMILRDVPKENLLELWASGTTLWGPFRIYYQNRKRFSIRLIKNGRTLKTFVLWDVIGYFQSSFVVACEKWLGDFAVLEDIQEMKLQRSTFKSENIEEIIEYNRKECLLLVMLVERLFASLDEAKVELVRYDGAGSIAAALLRKHEIQKFKGDVPAWVNRYAQYAYSGGRIEAIKCGTTTRRTNIWQSDINSAYPYVCLSLPSYVGATWSKDSEWDGSSNSLVCVRYHFAKEAPFYPLWFRDSNGSISYPRQGYGIYWGAEVANLYKYYEDGVDFEIEFAVNCTLATDDLPFLFIEDLYALRMKFKAEGSMASESLKLGLNSIYGKLVQQAGYREGRIPTYHQLLWGGQITAGTRARLYDLAMQSPRDIISFATDAIFTTKELTVPSGSELGEFTTTKYQGMTLVQAGVYFLDKEGDWSEKFRGFDKKSLQRDGIIQCWKDGTEYEAELTRFTGLGSALMATDFSCWRTWSTDSRKLDIRPTGKRIAGSRTDFYAGLRTTKPSPNITPDTLSKPYSLIWIDGVRGTVVDSNGVSLETLVDEYEDGML
jgi:hypothetical protein